MYKKRIRRWQLHKYKRRNRPGAEEAEFRAASGEDIPTGSGQGQATMSIVTRTSTSPPPALPPQLRDLEADHSVQTLLLSLRQLSIMPTKALASRTKEVGHALSSAALPIVQLYMAFSLGLTLFARGEGRLAGKAVRKAFIILEEVVRDVHFGLDWLLIDLLYDLVTRRQDALYATLTTHLVNVADAYLPRHHPLHRVASQLLRYGMGGDLSTLLQRAFFIKVDAVQSDPEVRAALLAKKSSANELFVISDEIAEPTDWEKKLMADGMIATHYETERQKGWAGAGAGAGIAVRGKNTNKSTGNVTSPSSSSSSFPLSYSSSSSSSSSSCSCCTTPHPPSPAPSFITTTSTRNKDADAPLSLFITERTQRSLERMRKEKKKPDALTLSVASRLFFSESAPQLAEMYKLKALSYEHQRRQEWDAAAATQRALLAFMHETTPVDHWTIARELWVLERLLLETTAAATGERERERELEAIAVEVEERMGVFLGDIPDDAP
jgi:hypothetical protein